MKKRWITLFVENEIGVLAKVTVLFSGKSYNLNSLTVGTTEDKTMSRMTISLTSDDKTFEQVKKQCNRCVEVIKVIDYTHMDFICKELMFIKIKKCTDKDIETIRMSIDASSSSVIALDHETMLIECVATEEHNNHVISSVEKAFHNRIDIVRGGSVGIER